MNEKISLITTVFNESASIEALLASILNQTRRPDEVVIVDANSTDETADLVRKFATAHPELGINLIAKSGNRSIGRNTAIEQAQHEIVAATDAGCVLQNIWLEEIVRPFNDVAVDFVGGWYQPRQKSSWDRTLAIVLGFDATNIDERTFLPSTRSMAFRKSLWKSVGGFDVLNSDSEDTPFSIAMRQASKNFIFAPKAIVLWSLVQSYGALYRTIRRYAHGDGRGRIWTSQYKILLIIMFLLILLLILGLLNFTFYWLAAALSIFYLYLPCFRQKMWPTGDRLYRVPFMRATLIAANILGFISGLSHVKNPQLKSSFQS